MIALSGAFHALLAVLALTVSSLGGPSFRLEPVAVVDLVGGGEARPAEAKAGPPAAPAAKGKAPPAKTAHRAEKAPPKGRAASKAAEKREAAAAEERAALRKRAADDRSVSERMRQLRESRAESESIRGAVEERRREAAARAAVRSVGERVAHRIEAPPPAKSAPAVGGSVGGGAQGTVRLSPELVGYFRKLEEAVRGNWVLPEALVRDAGRLMVEVRIVIEKDGRVSDARIEKGSGNAYFDESVRRAIRKASPLPVPPEQLRGGEDHYEVGFRFHGAGGAA